MVKDPLTNAGVARNAHLIPGSGVCPAGGNGNPLQYSCLENLADRGAWWATVHAVAKSQTRLSTHTMHPAYFSSIKKKEVFPYMITWMNFESIVLSEPSQREDKYCMILLTCRI